MAPVIHTPSTERRARESLCSVRRHPGQEKKTGHGRSRSFRHGMDHGDSALTPQHHRNVVAFEARRCYVERSIFVDITHGCSVSTRTDAEGRTRRRCKR